ncbi:hypothetical protein Ocin01_14737 [Orchesella cincta]|uniref:F-box domain-containing protein n=1 Tax=Orchesella cincta TaxID=48709 RepID=A0A1D2MG18_ORCCI|nr:hypothetical protein Ocin01_14737 [Orchesella cincta]
MGEGDWEKTDPPELQFNPLDIPYVLQLVLKNLSVWNLRKCRLVCKYWNSEATSVMRKLSKISIRTENALEELMSQDLSKLCQSFDLKNEVKLKSTQTQDFFKRFGDNMKSLDISFHHEYGSAVIAEIFPYTPNVEELCLNGRAHFLYDENSRNTLMRVLPKLKCLFIYDSSFDLNGFEPRRIWAENVFHILSGAVNLEKIFYAPFLESRAKMFFEILKCQPVHHSNLSHLHINHLWMNPEETDTLVAQKYPLKYIHLVLTSHISRNSLNGLLSSVKETLRELTLTFTDGTSCLEFHPISPLDKIRKLSMIGYDGPLIVANAPALQLFVISLPDSTISPGNIWINPDLEGLEIYDFQIKYNLDYLKALFKMFESLKLLKINNVNNDILRAVYAYLPKLCELRTCFHKFYGVASSRIDSGLNGLASNKHDEELLELWDDRDVNHLRMNPWMGQLKHLKHLTLEVGLISDFGIVLGMARCKTLKELILKNTGGHFEDSGDSRLILTDRSLRVITEEMDLHYLKIDGFSHMFSSTAIEQAKECMASREFIIV